ncbi:hypothetical protein INS49_014878 [Diaporthe citri]|uniref:uncharacterized protein n=1 Tax=Diaporthe citri TaxID=83186 RepID=UPI001C81D015|nr:uncharacterized protein INS49_014878 [Diaporthe citri]KAG6357002.1 hypothetical protein INS49_014878 [Diaporthe citri]
MSETVVQSDQIDGAEVDEAVLSLDIGLEDVVSGEEDTFRTQNTSMTDFERRNIIERTGGNVHTRVELLDVTHGRLSDGDEGTLMVLRFLFDPRKNSSRVLRGEVKIDFFAADEDDDCPVVESIAPDGRFTVMSTTDQVSTTRGGDLNLGVSGASVASISATAKLEKTRSRDVSDSTKVIGSINLGTGRNKGDPTAAAWNLLENKHRKSGVPDSLTVAILLRRTDCELFNAKVTLEADCDFATGLRSKFKKVPLDDPVLFNSRLTGRKAKKGRHYGTENLDNVSLDSLCEVRMDVQAPFAIGGEATY